MFLTDLLKLTINCFPDPFIEIRWESVSLIVRELILTTVIPYLSAMDRRDLDSVERQSVVDGWSFSTS